MPPCPGDSPLSMSSGAQDIPGDDFTWLSFKVSSEPVGWAFIDEVFDEVLARPSVPFVRAIEDEPGE